MYYLDTLRCSSCPRILARDLRLGDGSEVRAMCWGCGVVNVISVGEAPQLIADVVTAAVEKSPSLPSKGAEGKVQEAVGSDGGFAVKGG